VISRPRSSLLLLGLCVAALALGGLRLLTETPQFPTGSSYSPRPDGAQGLYEWSQALGGQPRRLPQLPRPGDAPPRTLFIIQPEAVVDATARTTFDRVADQGGTLVLAGDSISTLVYARSLGVALDLLPSLARTARVPDGSLELAVPWRYRLRAPNATPLLVTPGGDAVAIRLDYLHGTLVVVASSAVLTNQGLGDEAVARFVYRQLLSPPAAGDVAFDEVHHPFAPVGGSASPSVDWLLFNTAPGRAVLYAAVLTFAFLLLGGRRLGPPVAARAPSSVRRTMYEHVQMLASLYRRAGQLDVLRGAFIRHYARRLAHAAPPDTTQAIVARIAAARSETELIAAVAAADDAG
jgi:hypothetical protein